MITSDPIEQIPPPPVIRERLSQVVREADLLRRLLRLSESVANSGLRSLSHSQAEEASVNA